MTSRFLALAAVLLVGTTTFALSAPAAAAPVPVAPIPVPTCDDPPCDPPPLQLRVDRPRYAVGTEPRYTVRFGAPNTPIFWSSFKNGVSTGEVNSFYGHYTNGAGSFSATGGTWTSVEVGRWIKQASIGGDMASVSFSVVPQCSYRFYATKVFVADESYAGCKGTLIMQSDGNLVLYDEFDVPRFSSHTSGYSGAYAVFQDDGNFVVYAAWGTPLWASNTTAPGGRLELQVDGNLVIYNQFGAAVWATNTGH